MVDALSSGAYCMAFSRSRSSGVIFSQRRYSWHRFTSTWPAVTWTRPAPPLLDQVRLPLVRAPVWNMIARGCPRSRSLMPICRCAHPSIFCLPGMASRLNLLRGLPAVRPEGDAGLRVQYGRQLEPGEGSVPVRKPWSRRPASSAMGNTGDHTAPRISPVWPEGSHRCA